MLRDSVTGSLFEAPDTKPVSSLQPSRTPKTRRPVNSARWIDRHSGELFNSSRARTFRVQRDLRKEALREKAVDLAPWQRMRPNAAADDRALWRQLELKAADIDQEFAAVHALLQGRARLFIRHKGTPNMRTYIALGSRRLLAVNVRSQDLAAVGLRAITMRIKRLGRAEQQLRDRIAHIQALCASIDNGFAAVRSAERRQVSKSHPLIWPPLVARRLALLRKSQARAVEIAGPYCPTPHIQFEGWRVRMLALSDALKSAVMTLNRTYNVRRRRSRQSYGLPRRVRFGLITFMARSSWLLPFLQWRLVLRARADANVITSNEVRHRVHSRAHGWRDTGNRALVSTPDGRLNPVALALSHQPEMYPLFQPFDEFVQRYNEIAQRVLTAAIAVLGARPSYHPYGGEPRARWRADLNVSWWA